jgi:hypothetical protein
VEVLTMRARPLDLLPLVLALAGAGCISEDEWSKYNKQPGDVCESADECTSCPSGATWTCEGPSGDEGICTLRDVGSGGVRQGICRGSAGEPGVNCSAENPGACDYSYCVYAGAAEKGVCSRVCDDGVCPGARFVCIQTNRQSGGVMNWCAQRCTTNVECDTHSTCQTAPSGETVCFPG